MELYHGTTADFSEPNLSAACDYTDFGRGFYLTAEYRMAAEWLFGKENKHVNVYDVTLELIPTCSLRIKRFERADEQWAKFIYQNRRSKLSQHYDLIIGPLADNGLKNWFAKIDSKELSWDEMAKSIGYHRFRSPQYCFTSDKSLQLLKYVKRR